MPIDQYSIPLEAFGILKNRCKRIEWISCRDIFQSIRNSIFEKQGMLFHSVHCDNAVKLIKRIEKHLKIKNKSKFKKTNRNNIIHIEISSFWLSSKIRKSFFTLVLRCAEHYFEKISTLEIMKDNLYGKATKTAIKKFLDGNTHFRYNGSYGYGSNGWYYFFREYTLRSQGFIKRLVKP